MHYDNCADSRFEVAATNKCAYNALGEKSGYVAVRNQGTRGGASCPRIDLLSCKCLEIAISALVSIITPKKMSEFTVSYECLVCQHIKCLFMLIDLIFCHSGEL